MIRKYNSAWHDDSFSELWITKFLYVSRNSDGCKFVFIRSFRSLFLWMNASWMHLREWRRLHKRLLVREIHIRVLLRQNCESSLAGRGQNGGCPMHAEECVTLGDARCCCHAVTTCEALVKDKQCDDIALVRIKRDVGWVIFYWSDTMMKFRYYYFNSNF